MSTTYKHYNDADNNPIQVESAVRDGIGRTISETYATITYVDDAIEAIELKSDVIDVVGTYQDLQNYDTSKVRLNDLIKVINDETHNNAISYYRWESVSGVNQWVFVASEGPFYTKSEVDNIAAHAVNITWSALKSLRDGGTLVPGRFYRITDYTTTTSTANSSSAGNQFDIIVLALSNNSLSEEAFAALHSGDTYFANSDLESWRVWYSIDNDTSRFDWANTSTGKGVIYRLIDEFGNDLPYDFKNIQFNRGGTYRYTFYNSSNDVSLDGYNLKIYDNIIKPYKVNGVQKLNFNTFSLGGMTLQGQCYSNEFGFNSHDNQLPVDFNNNNIKSNFYSNNFINAGAKGNTIGNFFHDNTIDFYFQNNNVGDNFASNNIESNFLSNQIGNGFYSNTVGRYFQNNIVGSDFQHNKIGEYYGSLIQVRWCKFDSNLQYLCLTSDESEYGGKWIQNVHLHSGLVGASTQNPLTVSVYARNLPFEVEYYLDESGNLTMSNFTSKITWLALKDLRDNGNLVPGRKYRIIDYTTRTSQTNTQSAGHIFDIIVEALSSNTLSEKASACLHEGDTYFANSNLAAWQLWYCLDNDTNRFAWADTSEDGDITSITAGIMPYERDSSADHSGDAHPYAWSYKEMIMPLTVYTDSVKPSVGDSVYSSSTAADPSKTISSISGNFLPVGRGVIYRMIDEFGNDLPYDFKNILYTYEPSFNCVINFDAQTYKLVHDPSLDGDGYYGWRVTTGAVPHHWPYNYCFTTTRTITSTITLYGDSQLTYIASYDEIKNIDNTYLNAVYTFTRNSADASLSSAQKCFNNIIKPYKVLSDNVFQFNWTIFSNAYDCHNNIIAEDNNNNVFQSQHIYYNRIGVKFCNNRLQQAVYYNIIEGDCHDNSIKSNFYNNTIGERFNHNNIDQSFINNTISSGFNYNTIGRNFTNNNISIEFGNNTIGNYCQSNVIGSDFNNNTTSNYFQYNYVGNKCGYCTFGQYFNNSVLNNNVNTIVTNNYIKWCTFDNGVKYINFTSDDTSATSSNQIQNVHIHAGVQGTSSSSLRTISIEDRNLAYSTDVYANNSKQIILDD